MRQYRSFFILFYTCFLKYSPYEKRLNKKLEIKRIISYIYNISFFGLSIYAFVTKRIEFVMVDQPHPCATHVSSFSVKLIPLCLFNFLFVQLLNSLYQVKEQFKNSR